MTNLGSEDFNFKATGIGSVPSLDVTGTCLNIIKLFPHIPFWPQFVRRSHLEDMIIQFSEGLPCLEINEDKRVLVFLPENQESELITFYDHFLADDIDYFAISREYAHGLYEQTKLIREHSDRLGPYIKGQTAGPVTFAAAINGPDGKSVLSNPDLLEALTKGLAIKALWQARELGNSGKKPIIFLDEPYLSGFGSAFSPIGRDEVIFLIREIISYLRERIDLLIGIHCCGNTDWSMIMESEPDIVNFDAYAFLDYFLLYPEDIKHFLNRGGSIAWGIVPTFDFTGEETVRDIQERLEYGLKHLHDFGIDTDLIYSRSMLTPACGMGTMGESLSDMVLEITSSLSKNMRLIYGAGPE